MTVTTAVPARSEIAAEYTWNGPSLFESTERWENGCEQLALDLARLYAFRGHLAEGPATLLNALAVIDDLQAQMGKIFTYASMSYNVNTTDQQAQTMYGRAGGLYGRLAEAMSFLDPELLAIGEPTLRSWLSEEPRLAFAAHYVDDLFRQQQHIRSAEVEAILGALSDPFRTASTTYSMLTDADLRFRDLATSSGEAQPVFQGNIDAILNSGDREARRTAWESYADGYLAFKNTLASALSGSVRQDVFMARTRGYASSLEAALFRGNIPVEVFHNLIAVFRKNLPTWHRYFAVRRRALRIAELHTYDIWAPLTNQDPVVHFNQAVDWISDGMAPLGKDYVEALRHGCLNDRWVDRYPSQGKGAGAFSTGFKGTLPFIMMSYVDTLESMSTLAHELGHSMHSFLTWNTHPYLYSQYSLFVAETASNFNQAMTRAYLLAHNPEKHFQIGLIEEAMRNFHRYFFIMPTLARFELEFHQRVESGQSPSADDLIALMSDLYAEGYGSEVHLDRERVGITWAQFGHLYEGFYVFQYATGISAAHALSRRILSGTPGAADDYLSFLRAGSSLYPLDALKLAGVDLSTPEPVEQTFEVLAELVDRLDKLIE